MSIKADRWIKRMSLEHGMIEPFEERQVRQGVVLMLVNTLNSSATRRS